MAIDAFKDFRLDGHKVIITGGAQNIGAGIAKTFSAAGADVLIADLKGDLARATAEAIEKETQHKCRGIACDVTKEEDIQATVAMAVREFGGITTLVNNVGWGGVNPDPLAVTEEELPDGAEGLPEEIVLMKQHFIKDGSKTIEQLVKDAIAQTGENIRVRRFTRYELGQ